MNTFKQGKLFIKKGYTFKEDGLDFYSKDYDGEFTKFIHFNEIEPRNKCRIYTEKYPKILQGGLLLAVAALLRGLLTNDIDLKKSLIITGIVAFFGLVTILAYFIFRIKYFLIELEDETQIFVLLDSPSKQKMEEFIDELFKRRRTYYREQYFYINYESERQKELDKMKWLRNEDIISENEFLVVVDEINESLSS